MTENNKTAEIEFELAVLEAQAEDLRKALTDNVESSDDEVTEIDLDEETMIPMDEEITMVRIPIFFEPEITVREPSMVVPLGLRPTPTYADDEMPVAPKLANLIPLGFR